MTEKQWDAVSSRVGAINNFGIEKKAWLQSNQLARLIAAVPFLAGCKKSMETSLSHLSIYVMALDESVKDVFFHSEEDDEDIYSRLFPISGFLGGDESIIQCCLDLMALTMISNYNNDMESDKSIGKYNPLSSGKWDYTHTTEELKKKINSTITPEIAEIYSVDTALRGIWKE